MDISNNQQTGSLNIEDMLAEAAKAAPDGESIFSVSSKKPEEPPVEQSVKEPEPKAEINTKGAWVPDVDTTDLGLTESTGIVYGKDEIKNAPETVLLENMSDSIAREETKDKISDMDFVQEKIENAKKALGIKHLAIPAQFNHEVITIASDPSPGSIDQLIAKLKDLTEQFPHSVVERYGEVKEAPKEDQDTEPKVPDNVVEYPVEDGPAKKRNRTDLASINPNDDPEITVLIDKTKVPELAFDQEDIDKIKAARSVKVQMVQEFSTKFTIVDDDNIKPLDKILSPRDTRVGQFPLTLPASHYRATMTGLSYPEVMDLSYSMNLNRYDAELQKWTIAYRHIKNASIGEFMDFNDFMDKTSYIDLNILLWGVICATTFDGEVVPIDCRVRGCGKTYQHIYVPSELVDWDLMAEETLDEIQQSAGAETMDNIIAHYNTSCLKQKRYVTLPTSNFVVCVGHPSANKYLKDLQARVIQLRETGGQNIKIMSESVALAAATIVDHILIPKEDGSGYAKISKVANIDEIVKNLKEIDSKTMIRLMEDIVSPYDVPFSIKNVICPNCGNKSDIMIGEMSSLLFTVARSLWSGTVELVRS
jgi:hypothetical protein